MIEELKKIMSDPFEVKSVAPLGYEFLMSSFLGPHNKIFAYRQKAYWSRANQFISESNYDYLSIPFRSYPLSEKQIEFEDSLSAALFRRKSIREFAVGTTTFDQISFILKLAAGIRNKREGTRFYPSGGGLYTLRIYVYAKNIQGLEKGVYLFNPLKNTLDLINNRIIDEEVSKLHNEQNSTAVNSSFEIWISTRPRLALKKYSEHGWKIILIEMGHLAQNLWLVSVGCGLSMFPCSNLNIAQSEKILNTNAMGELLVYSLVGGIGSPE